MTQQWTGAGCIALLACAFLGITDGASAQAAREQGLAAHRGVYELTLDPRRPARNVDNAAGRIVFETSGNLCDGFTTNFRQVVELGAGGQRITMDVRTANFEDGDGRLFRFVSRATENGQPREETDGEARRTDADMRIAVTKPRPVNASFDGEIIFPTEHLRRILQAARAGRPILEVRVYDGSETGEKLFNTTAVIGRLIAPGTGEIEAPSRDGRLADLPRWPVSISYFEVGKDSPLPAYTIAFELFDNGVSRALVIDYGDFALRGRLASIDWLPEAACDRQ